MEISNKQVIAAPAHKVWQILAKEFAQVDNWAASVHRSESPSGRVAAELGADRACSTSLGRFRETVTNFDEQGMTFSYQAHGGPPIMKEVVNTWTVVTRGDRTEVSALTRMQLAPLIGPLLKPLLRRQMGRTIAEAIEELKHYAETGEPHPRKTKAMARVRGKA